MIVLLIGGIGLFLMGMILMTDGLKALAGDSLRRIIGRFASGPLSSVAAGTTLTVLVQSSHATTLATIGFVSSGLLTFQQSLGVIVGANLGTTSTGWLVALLGFKLNISAIAFVFVGVGALMRLLGRDRIASAGVVCAGFGLIFVGIDTLQGGMGELAQRMTPEDLPSGTIMGRLLLVVFGFLMTVVMQSSSAAIATTLTALHAGTVSFDQAAALVIGQNVGSSVTAAVAAFGASVPAKRTALAHILFNVITAVVAFAILPIFVEFVNVLADTWARGNEAIALAAFHTMFKLLGVAIFMPLLSTFAVMLTRLVPDRGPVLTRHLDATVGREPQAAVEAAHVTLVAVLAEQARMARSLLQSQPIRDLELSYNATREALGRTSDFMADISGTYKNDGVRRRSLAVAHALDHQRSLADTLREKQHMDVIRNVSAIRRDGEELARALEGVLVSAHTSDEPEMAKRLADLSKKLADSRRARRQHVLADTASGKITPEEALRELDAIRWIDRLCYHVWRSAAHLFDGTSEEVGVLPLSDE